MLSQRSFFIAWWGLRILVMSRSKIYLTTQRLDLSSPSSMTKAYYWDTCGSPVIKWKNCAIVPSGHWVLNTMTTNCDPMRCSHTDHACYLDDDWRCHAQTGPGHMTNTRFCSWNSLVSCFAFQRIWIAISWSIMAQTRKILTDAYTSRINRG